MSNIGTPVPARECAVKISSDSTIRGILENSQNNLNDCEGMVDTLLTFIDGGDKTGESPRNTTSLTSQAVNIRDQTEHVREGLSHILDTLGAR